MTDKFKTIFGQPDDAPPSTFTERVRGASSAGATDPRDDQSSADGQYRAFGYLPVGFGETCDIRRWMEGTDVAHGLEFQYRFLLQVGYVGDQEIRLFLPDCIVVIEGRNLSELRTRLRRRQCTFVQQHSSRIWTAPSDEETVVHCINVLRGSSIAM